MILSLFFLVLARFSKYYFGIPEKIWHYKKKQKFFELKIIFRKSHEKNFRDQKFSGKFSSKNQLEKWTFWNFKKVRKFFKNFVKKFPMSNFENIFSSWKINIFHPDFFSWQGMIILYRKITLALSLFDFGKLGTGRGPRTLQIHPDLPSSNIFSREASYVII